MRLPDTLIALVAGVLASSPLAACQLLGNRSEEGGVQRRASAGGKCGPAAGGVSCDAGLCCSESGTCGTGGEFCTAPGCLLAYGPACDGNKRPTGSDTSNTPRPKFGSIPYGVDISSCTVPGKLALTFDDGPYIYTAALLDLLKKNNARATFFVNGNNGAKGDISAASSGYAPIVQRMIAEGHQVASHTWSHENLDSISPDLRRKQFIYNEIALASILGVIPTYFRPPYTVCNGDCMAELGSLGYHVVNYDVDPKDWENEGVNAKSIFTSAIDSGSQSEYLVLAHDIQPNTVNEFAQFMIDKAHAKGFEIVPAGECLGDPESNWYRDPSTGAARSARGATPQEPEPEPSKSTATSATLSTTSQKKVVVTPTPVPSFKVTELPRNSTTSASSTVTKSSSTLLTTTTGTTSTTTAAQTSPTGAADLARPGMWLGLLGLGVGLVLA